MKGSCAKKPGSIGGLPFFNQQADGLEIPGFVSGIVQARPAALKSELCQVTENEVEPRVPPLCKVPVLEALARGEACPGARVESHKRLSQWVDVQYVADCSNDIYVVSPHIEPHFV